MSILDKIQKSVQNIPSEIEILKATVINTKPLQLEIIGDVKRQPSENIIDVPQPLTDYDLNIDIKMNKDSVIDCNISSINDGGDNAAEHTHELTKLNLNNYTLTIKNALKKNDKVLCISYNRGQRYLILDRLSGDDSGSNS